MFNSQDCTRHTSLVRQIAHEKMPLVLKAECRFTRHASRFQNCQSIIQGDECRMCSLAVNFPPPTCPHEQLHVTPAGFLCTSCKEYFSVHLSVTAMVQENLLIACFYLFQLPHTFPSPSFMTRGLLPYWLIPYSSFCPIRPSHTTPLNTMHIARSI